MSHWGWDESRGHWAGCFELWQCYQLLSCLLTSLANAVQLAALNAISETQAQAAQAPSTEQEEAGVTMTRKTQRGPRVDLWNVDLSNKLNPWWFQSIKMYQVPFWILWMRQHPHMSVRIPSRPSFDAKPAATSSNSHKFRPAICFGIESSRFRTFVQMKLPQTQQLWSDDQLSFNRCPMT